MNNSVSVTTKEITEALERLGLPEKNYKSKNGDQKSPSRSSTKICPGCAQNYVNDVVLPCKHAICQGCYNDTGHACPVCP